MLIIAFICVKNACHKYELFKQFFKDIISGIPQPKKKKLRSRIGAKKKNDKTIMVHEQKEYNDQKTNTHKRNVRKKKT